MDDTDSTVSAAATPNSAKHGLHQVRYAAMLDEHALWATGGAGRVNHVGEVSRRHRCSIGHPHAVCCGATVAEVDDGGRELVPPKGGS